MMKPGVVVIDVAINFDNGKMVGDAYHPAYLDKLEKLFLQLLLCRAGRSHDRCFTTPKLPRFV